MARRPLLTYRSTSLTLILSFLPCVYATAQDFEFVDVSAARGILPNMPDIGQGTGGAVADYDKDGFPDIFVPQAAGTPHRLYRNQGNGVFEEVAGDVGLASTEAAKVALWVDYDADADLDLFVVNDSPTATTTFRLYRQSISGTFTDVTMEAGLFMVTPPANHWGGIAAGDINNDGYLDVYTVQWGSSNIGETGRGYMFLNNTNGTFTEIGVASGLDEVGDGHQPVMMDFNDDGWLDIIVAIDFNANKLWINQQDNTFLNLAASANLDNNMNDMGVAISDYDNDGDLDIYVTNIFVSGKHNVLHRNDTTPGNVTFTEVAAAMGVDDGEWGWGTTFIDGDNDGWLDIAATNGRGGGSWENDPSKYFLNPGGGAPFVDVSSTVNFDDTFVGSVLVTADFERDGRLDLLQICSGFQVSQGQHTIGPVRVLQNIPAKGASTANYLVVQPRMIGPNHFAIGAEVRATFNGMTTARLITAGNSYLGQEPAEAFFGLGAANTVDTLTIDWPDGTMTVLEDVSANQILKVTGGGFPIPAVSAWGLLTAALLLLTLATIIYDDPVRGSPAA